MSFWKIPIEHVFDFWSEFVKIIRNLDFSLQQAYFDRFNQLRNGDKLYQGFSSFGEDNLFSLKCLSNEFG